MSNPTEGQPDAIETFETSHYITIVRDWIFEATRETCVDVAYNGRTYPPDLPEGWQYADVDDDQVIRNGAGDEVGG